MGLNQKLQQIQDEENERLAKLQPGYRPEAISQINDEPEKLYLVCTNCGEAFDDLTAAHEHGAADPNTKSWCGDEGFMLLPESEAM